MTTIVAIETSSGVTIGADSKVTDSTGAHWIHRDAKKITKVGKYLIAGSGDVDALDIAHHLWTPPTPTVKDKKDIYHFIIAKVIPSLKRAMKDNDYKIIPDKDEDERFNLIIAVEGRVFEVADGFSVVMREDGIYGIGSGSNLARGALYAGATIEQALTIAATHDIYTAPPFLILTQEK
jgi:ATP-dependent protease HslVU (ClpYQ) peptidase subunit